MNLPSAEAVHLNATSEDYGPPEEVAMPVNPLYDDLESEIYKAALLEVFEAQVPERYGHLNGEQLD